jgi:DUF971 family protein
LRIVTRGGGLFVRRTRLLRTSILNAAVPDPVPTEIKLRSRSRVLCVAFDDGAGFELPFEYLRVHSPSAEVKGHGPGQEVLVIGKENVGIRAVEPVGQYAVKLVFDDGHDTGLYSWKYLYELGRDRAQKWAHYLERKREAAQRR